MPSGVELALQVILLGSGLLLGVTGFGHAMLATPMMLLFLDAKSTIVIVRLVSLPALLAMSLAYRFPVDWRIISRLIIPASVGAIAGTLVLSATAAKVLVLAVGLTIIGAAGASLVRGLEGKLNLRYHLPLLGLIAGLLGGSIGFAGPPIVFGLAHNHFENKDQFRGTLLAFFALANIVSLIGFATLGLIDGPRLKVALRLLPATLVGVAVGERWVRNLSNVLFQRLVMITMIALAILSMGTQL